MIDPKASDDQKLATARELAEETSEHYQPCNDERSLCSRFYHNSGGVGQWREKDLEYLRKQGRQPLTHNVLKTKIDTMIGMHMEQQRKPVLRPVGAEDEFKVLVMNSLCERISEEAGLEEACAKTLQNGYREGEGDTVVSTEPDSSNPAFVRVEAYSAEPQEIGWDPGSMKEDRSDAGYVLWERWLTRAEFVREYPEHKKAWDELSGDGQTGGPDSVLEFAQGGESSVWEREDYGKRRSHYFDRKKRRARIIRMEYRCLQKQTYAIQQGGAALLTQEQVEIAREDTFGYWERAGIQLQDVDSETVHILEFCGVKILFDSTKENRGRPPLPFSGLSVEPFIFAIDSQDRIPYGPARDLMPAQEELNKGCVSNIDLAVGQGKTGYLYEDGAIDDEALFESQINTTGSAARVNKNALTEGRIQPRQVATFSPAQIQRIEMSLSLIDRISAISADLEQPASLNEPATSAILRYHKSQLGLASPRAHFDTHLKNVYRKLVEIVMRVMPDQQIEALLGNQQRFRVQNGFVFDMQSNPQQPNAFHIRDLRALKYDIELDTSTKSQTLRSLKVRQWLELHTAGVPIPLEMIAEAATDSRSEREKLRQYAEQQAAQAAQAQQAAAQEMSQQIQQTLAIEAGRVAEQSRHNQAEEALKAKKQEGDILSDMATIWEKADESEKGRIIETFRALQQRQTARESLMARVNAAPVRGSASPGRILQ